MSYDSQEKRPQKQILPFRGGVLPKPELICNEWNKRFFIGKTSNCQVICKRELPQSFSYFITGLQQLDKSIWLQIVDCRLRMNTLGEWKMFWSTGAIAFRIGNLGFRIEINKAQIRDLFRIPKSAIDWLQRTSAWRKDVKTSFWGGSRPGSQGRILYFILFLQNFGMYFALFSSQAITNDVYLSPS